ncbi:hypothetical protein SAMN02745181_3819 [Rubritalea squalenifaciens DSM 18772]|uniref:Uncharacterized protein n=1 Tax=Rubritalea squalenifaciens DSM 18772 TaxID=1123071 RepID=A0A1M6SGF5_9BACT|nr:hypothetical protein [Rubritalea squalenifaciens]SHK43789.1 hypothetical protein SAMN02745181_3819 [Rubritalea squalenifaciens DSM 18772]
MKSPYHALLLVLLPSLLSCSSEKKHCVKHLIPDEFLNRWECIVYGVEGANPLDKDQHIMTADIPHDGILLTSTELPADGCDDAFFFELADGGLSEVPDEFLHDDLSHTGSISSGAYGIDCDFHATWIGKEREKASLEKLKERVVKKIIKHYSHKNSSTRSSARHSQ